MKTLLTLLCILCYTLPVAAQNEEFALHNITLPAKFSQQIITCLEQDKLGMLWFVTNEGLFRYDGNEVIQLGPETNPKIPHMIIKTLFADNQGNMWIGAQDGITRLNLRDWTTTEIKAPAGTPALGLYIRVITQDHNGVIYAGTQNGCIYRIQQDSLVSLFDMNRIFKDLYDLPNITFIKEPYPGKLWVGTSVGKMACITINKDGTYSQPVFYGLDQFKRQQIITADFGPAGNCVIVVPYVGLYFMNTKTGAIRKLKGPYGDLGKHGQVFMVPLDKNRSIILTNTPGIGKEKLFIYDFTKDSISFQNLHYPRYLEDNHIVWLSHSGSKVLLSLNDHLLELTPSNSPFRALMAEPNSLNSIRAIYKQPDGPLLAGSYKDGFVTFDERNGNKKVVARKYVYSFLPWNRDSVLLSTEGDGLFWYEIKRNKLTPLVIAEQNIKGKPMGKFLTFLLRYDEQHFLVGTYERLYMVNPYSHTAKSIREDRLLKTRVLNLLKFNKDYLIATEHDILKWNGKTDAISDFVVDDRKKESEKFPVYGMIAVKDKIWAATSGYGIIIFNSEGKPLDTIGRAEGLSANIVFTLAATDKYVLAGTKNGLSVISKATHRVANYSTIDQLPANEFNSGAIYQSGNTVYLGTIDGVVRFNTDKLKPDLAENMEGNLYITDLTITDKKGNAVNDYTLPYQNNRTFLIPAQTAYFSIGFGSMQPSMEALDYYYRLNPEQAWIPVGNSRKVTFIGMPPDHYQMELAARLPDGKWTRPLLSMSVIVAPAFYQTIWFKLVIALLILALVWGIIKYREQQAEKERALRLKIAGDLHDEIGSTLAGMSMQAEMLLSGYQEHQKAYLKSIADNGRAAVQTMGDIVWSIDPRNDDSLSLYQRMERYGNKIFGDSDIAINLESHGFTEKQYIPQKIRQNVMLIYKEALTNIIKHAEASSVDVSFVAYNKGFKLFITDNGRGLAASGTSMPKMSGHGLRNMEMRAKLIEADLMFPNVEKGFKIVLVFKG